MTSTPTIAKTRFCFGDSEPAVGLVLAYMNGQCRGQVRLTLC